MSLKTWREDAKTMTTIAADKVREGFSDGAWLVALAIIGGCICIAVSIALAASATR